MKRMVHALGELNCTKQVCPVLVLATMAAIALPAQTFSTLYSFCSQGTPCLDGAYPGAGLIQAANGDLYGTTNIGGANCPLFGCGTVFKIAPSGMLTTLYSFCPQGTPCTDGASPQAGLVQAANGDLYGTTDAGGAYIAGTVFKTTPSGTLTTLYSFCPLGGVCADGANPQAGLVQAANGDFYGTTNSGGTAGAGTIFKITPSGTLSTLYSFCSQSNCTDGGNPQSAKLSRGFNGDFYGTTVGGGYGCASGGACAGTIFKITPSGALTTVYTFCTQSGCPDGGSPLGGLIQTDSGDFYGTTEGGGSKGLGTAFVVTPAGVLTVLHSFCSETIDCLDGGKPQQGLIQASDGNFYGTTSNGGASCPNPVGLCGTVFRITPGGVLTTLHGFCSSVSLSGICLDGQWPSGTLFQDTNGVIYGETNYGGAGGWGTIFTLTGLAPFVKTWPMIGKVGSFVEIFGTDLTGSSSVSFNGAQAVFKVLLASTILAIIPAGASSGKVQVITPGGALSSIAAFLVLP